VLQLLKTLEAACAKGAGDKIFAASSLSVVPTRDPRRLTGGSCFEKQRVACASRAQKCLFLHPRFFSLPGCLQLKVLVHECVSRMTLGLHGVRASAHTAQFLNAMGGYFDVENREYVIVTPHTPTPWVNYLGLDGTLSGLMTQTGSGSVWFEDSLKYRLLRYNQIGSAENTPGRYLYVRDNRTGAFFSPTFDPVPDSPPEAFECRHGLGYTRIRSVWRGLFFDLLFLIPKGERHPVEIQSVTVDNLSSRSHDVSLFAYREFVNSDVLDEYVRPAIRNYTVHVMADPRHGILYNLTGRSMNNRQKPIYYFTSTARTTGFDTDYREFFGTGRLHCPDAVKEGRCRNSISHANTALGVHQVDWTLPPHGRKQTVFILGVMPQSLDGPADIAPNAASVRAVRAIRKHWSLKPAQAVAGALAGIRRQVDAMNSTFQCRLPPAAHPMQVMLNTWNGYGVWLNYLHARSLSDHFSGISRPFLGTRDSASDLLGIGQLAPAAARKRILEWCGAAQLQSGACYHHYNPRTRQNDGVTGYSDDQLWISLGTCVYIKETADFSILEDRAGYADAPDKLETVFMHMLRGMRYTLAHLGPHGIPRMLVSDWNHVFAASYEKNKADDKGRAKAESVMVGLMLVKMARDMQDMVTAYGHRSPSARRRYRKHAVFLQQVLDRATQAINRHTWFETPDGEGWYAMGSDPAGQFFGTPRDTEGRVFLIPQAWALLAGVANDARMARVLAAVKKYLFKPGNGLVLLTPPYRQPPPLGSFNVYPPGSRENGAIFCQAHGMAIPGLATTKDGDFVYEVYRSLLPAEASAALGPRQYAGPPYGYSQFRFGPDHPLYGQARGSLLTGTVAWSYYGACQWILGIRPDFDGLIVDPCIPRNWPGYTVERAFRGGLYQITVVNSGTGSNTVTAIEVDGKRIPGNKIPVLGPGTHHVAVRL
jgi:cellobiose phosphorylase